MMNIDMLPNEAERNPIVRIENGEVLASSRDVATFFGKEHRNVLRDIEGLLKTEQGLAERDFVADTYTVPATGQQAHRYFRRPSVHDDAFVRVGGAGGRLMESSAR